MPDMVPIQDESSPVHDMLIQALNESSFGAMRLKRRVALEQSSDESAEQVLLEIARCPVVASCYRGEDGDGCRKIVLSQSVDHAEFHLPEPWSGDLEKARILFLASNPSLWHEEDYPTAAWSDTDIIDFFHRRFAGGRKDWLKDDTRTLLKSGQHASRGTRFLQSVRNRATELLDHEAVPGADYALTEVVHCKSQQEFGVGEAMMPCNYRYLDRVLALSGAKVVIVLGRTARESLTYALNVPEFAVNSIYGPTTVGGMSRLFAFLPHPNSRGARRFADWPEEARERLQRFLQN
jgi:hypothetical protein